MAFVDDILLRSFLLLFSSIVLSSGSCWHRVQTAAASKEAFSCDEDLMCSSHGTKWHMFAPVATFSVFGLREVRGHVFIYHFLEVLVLMSGANEQT